MFAKNHDSHDPRTLRRFFVLVESKNTLRREYHKCVFHRPFFVGGLTQDVRWLLNRRIIFIYRVFDHSFGILSY